MTAPVVTIYDVARRAEVSISTVSLVVNHPDRVSASTRTKVLAAADELGFVPKADAVDRARRGVRRIGVLGPFSSYPSYYRRLNGLLGELRGADSQLDVVIFDHASAALGSPVLASIPLSRRLDGLVVMGLPLDDAVAERLHVHDLPTVLVDTSRRDFDSVVTDDRQGGALIAEHLLARGHRQIGYVQEITDRAARLPASVLLQGDLRLRGFREVVEAAGGTVEEVELRSVGSDMVEAEEAATALLARPERPTAVVAHDDLLAAGVLRAAHQLGLRVPEDVAVVGFDGSDLAEALGLTSVSQPFEESGAVAARALQAVLRDGPRPTRQVSLHLTLTVRTSS
jgi:DNA-binding LacI/PurR family transcriptional regulator